MSWKPKFKAGDCINTPRYTNICIRDVVIDYSEPNAGEYLFDKGNLWGPLADEKAELVSKGGRHHYKKKKKSLKKIKSRERKKTYRRR
jgi:hypothetical protein